MLVFGIMGMVMGVFGLIAFAKLVKLEKHLKVNGVLDKDYQ